MSDLSDASLRDLESVAQRAVARGWSLHAQPRVDRSPMDTPAVDPTALISLVEELRRRRAVESAMRAFRAGSRRTSVDEMSLEQLRVAVTWLASALQLVRDVEANARPESLKQIIDHALDEYETLGD